MARNHKFYFDRDGTPRARGPAAERVLMSFLEEDVGGSDHVCHDLMDDITAIEDGSDDQREFSGTTHNALISADGVVIEWVGPTNETDAAGGSGSDETYRTGLKHFREILEDWEAFILDDQLLDDPHIDDDER